MFSNLQYLCIYQTTTSDGAGVDSTYRQKHYSHTLKIIQLSSTH